MTESIDDEFGPIIFNVGHDGWYANETREINSLDVLVERVMNVVPTLLERYTI